MSDWHDEAVRLRDEGWVLSRIAQKFGVTKQAVYSAIQYKTDPEFAYRRELLRYRRMERKAAAE